MNHCKTCKHWKPFIEEFPRSEMHECNSGGFCKSNNLVEEYSNDDYAPNRLVYPYSEGGYFWTGPDFGCVNHEDKADE